MRNVSELVHFSADVGPSASEDDAGQVRHDVQDDRGRHRLVAQAGPEEHQAAQGRNGNLERMKGATMEGADEVPSAEARRAGGGHD